jgi:glycerol-3-phosphate dehydrogenase
MIRNLSTLSDNNEYDVLIVGAGIYGATAAWDATLRGLSVALIDKGDFGAATSANSLKIVHGGLRYLQTLDVERMRESIRERRILLHIAPHLVHPLHCVMPTYGYTTKSKTIMRMGMLMNDIISFDRNHRLDPQKRIPLGRIISKRECLRLIPGIDGARVTGGALWTDAQMHSSDRLLLSFVMSAVKAGAQAINYTEAIEFLRKDNRITGVRVKDVFTGENTDIRARVIVNAAGGWIDHGLKPMSGSSSRVRLSTAMNLVINRRVLHECAAGIHTPFEYTRSDGSVYHGNRVLFMTPWNRYTLVGTYHLPYNEHPDDLRVTENEIQSFLTEINRGYPGDPIRRDEVSYFHKGFLPMDGIDDKTGEVKLTKHSHIYDHAKEEGIEGLISMAGVKYTTARDVSEKAVNLVFEKLGRKPPKSKSRSSRLVGGEIDRFEDFMAEAEKHPPDGVDTRIVRHLVYHYGSEYKSILAYGKENPKWMEILPGSSEVIGAEIIHAVREEMAQTLADVVVRRTGLGSGGHPGKKALEACAKIMAKDKDWNKTRIKDEIDSVDKIYRPA